MRSGRAEDGTTLNEKCRSRIEIGMRKDNHPRIKQSEDTYTAYEEYLMRANDALEAKPQAAVHGRRGGVGGGDSGDGAEDRGRAEDQVQGGAEARGRADDQAQGERTSGDGE